MQEIKLADYKPSAYQIPQTNLEFFLDAEKTKVITTLTVNQVRPESLILNGEGLELLEVSIDGSVTNNFNYENDLLDLGVVPANCTVQITSVCAPDKNTQLMGLYKSGNMLCTQCEAEGFRRIAFYLDRPDVLSVFTVTLRASKASYPQLLSNGNIEDSGAEGDTHWVRWHDPHPKPCYLFALVAGELAKITDTFTTRSGRKVQLEIYTFEQDINQTDWAMQALKNSMAWDEQVYGCEYDLDLFMIVAVPDFNMGAMENKGLNIFNTKYILVDPNLSTDDDFMGVEAVVGHEYFHNYSGNRVTVSSWFQLSLKEGLTVFREQQFSAAMGSELAERIKQVNLLRMRQFPEDMGPLAHPVRPDSYAEINNFYTMTVYEKGAEVIRMLHSMLGHEVFTNGVKNYFKKHDGQAVTCEDFVAAVGEVGNTDLSQFERWYHTSGTPTLEFTGNYQGDKFVLSVTQGLKSGKPTASEPLVIPIKMSFVDDEGQVAASCSQGRNEDGTITLTLTERKADFAIDVRRGATPVLMQELSAPAVWSYPYTIEEKKRIIRHSVDYFARYDMSRNMMLSAINEQSISPSLTADLVHLYHKMIQENNISDELLSLLLVLPSYSYLFESSGLAQDKLIDSFISFKQEFSQGLLDTAVAKLNTIDLNEQFSHDKDARAKRALAGSLMNIIGAAGDEAQNGLLKDIYDSSTNMTIRMHALCGLNHHVSEERSQALEDFYSRYQQHALVVDKWFSLQAKFESLDSAKTVKELTKHSAFNWKNPNKVYALLAAFGISNPLGFHQDKGYELMADAIKKIDKDNPQVASRLATSFQSLNRVDEARRGKMVRVLEGLLKGASGDLTEIVTKTLGGQDTAAA